MPEPGHGFGAGSQGLAPYLEAEILDFLGPADPALTGVDTQLEPSLQPALDAAVDAVGRAFAPAEDDKVIRIPGEAMAAPVQFPIQLVEQDIGEQGGTERSEIDCEERAAPERSGGVRAAARIKADRLAARLPWSVPSGLRVTGLRCAGNGR